MTERLLNKRDYKLLERELNYCREVGIINEEQTQGILSLYKIRDGVSFIRVLVTIGAVLIGLGVMSFIASNWAEISKLTKFVIILCAYLGANIGGVILLNSSPKTGRALTYLGTLIFGAGIFLIGQMFNFGGHFSQAFLLWGLGIVPLALVLRDKLIYFFATFLMIIYMNGQISIDSFPYYIIAIVPAAYYGARYYDYAKPVVFLNNVLAINMLVVILNELGVHFGLITLMLFGLGLAMYLLPINFEGKIVRLQGSILSGFAGLLLTIPEFWDFLNPYISFENDMPNIIFAIVYLVILFLFTRSGNLISLAFICFTIFRFYADTMYAFKSKSLFFIIGGLILMGFGFYFEKLRKKQGGIING